VEEYDKTLAIDPNFKEAHYNKGLSLQNLKRYEEAIEEYDKTPSYRSLLYRCEL